MSKLKGCSAAGKDDEDYAEGEEARAGKMTQIRDHWSGVN
jgi:hypothetical protein